MKSVYCAVRTVEAEKVAVPLPQVPTGSGDSPTDLPLPVNGTLPQDLAETLRDRANGFVAQNKVHGPQLPERPTWKNHFDITLDLPENTQELPKTIGDLYKKYGIPTKFLNKDDLNKPIESIADIYNKGYIEIIGKKIEFDNDVPNNVYRLFDVLGMIPEKSKTPEYAPGHPLYVPPTGVPDPSGVKIPTQNLDKYLNLPPVLKQMLEDVDFYMDMKFQDDGDLMPMPGLKTPITLRPSK